MSRYDRFRNEMVAGGAVDEAAPEQVAGGSQGVVGVLAIVGLLALLAISNGWMFLFVLGVLVSVFLHELGHFVTSRWTGMKATQFFLGFGPRLFSFQRGETEYGLRALPLGAFVRIIGMNNMDEVPIADEPRTYRQQSYPKRMLVISAGSIMHILLAIALLFVVYSTRGEDTQVNGAELTQVDAAGAGAAAGLRAGDIVLAVDGRQVKGPDQLGQAIRANEPGTVVDVVVDRDGDTLTLPVGLGANTDEASPFFGDAFLGVGSRSVWDTIDHSVTGAAVNSVTDIFPVSWESTKGVIKVLNPLNIIDHLSGENEDLGSRPTTLVGVTQVSGIVGEEQGVMGILYVLAALNVFVGVFNMFPLLPLDGGHAAIATYERVRSRRGRRYFADVSKMVPFAMGVITLLLFLFLAGLYLDIAKPIG